MTINEKAPVKAFADEKWVKELVDEENVLFYKNAMDAPPIHTPIIIHTPESLEQFARKCFQDGMDNVNEDGSSDKPIFRYIEELKKDGVL